MQTKKEEPNLRFKAPQEIDWEVSIRFLYTKTSAQINWIRREYRNLVCANGIECPPRFYTPRVER